jgi:hypothetical protein
MKNTKCLQCGKPATEKGETYNGRAIRECADGHRTLAANAEEIKRSAAMVKAARKAAKDNEIEFTPREGVAA